MSNPRCVGRRGLASLLAIGSIGLLAVALASMSLAFRDEFRRTRAAAADAQARQLLLAGAADVRERAAGWGESVAKNQWEVALPDALAAGGAKLALRLSPSGAAVEAEVEARVAGARAARQVLRFVRDGGRWRLESARLQ